MKISLKLPIIPNHFLNIIEKNLKIIKSKLYLTYCN